MRDREQMHTPSARCRESLRMEFGLDVRPHELLVALAALELTYLNSSNFTCTSALVIVISVITSYNCTKE